MSSRHFTPALFAFLRDLAQHNDRAWFQANKQRYVDDVQEPALAFIATCRLTQREVTSSGFSDALARRFRAATPFMRFLCRAIDVEF